MPCSSVVTTLLVGSVLTSLAAGAGGADLQPRTLIFAAAEYEHLQSAPLLAAAADAWRQRLTPVQPVAVPAAPTARQLRQRIAEVIDERDGDSPLLVVILAHGLQIGGVDYICCADTSLDEIKQLGSTAPPARPRSLVSLQEIVRKLSTAGRARQLIVVDSARLPPLPANFQSLGRKMVSRFGSQPLQIGESQWIICNRSGKTAEGPAGQTVFGNALLSGLTADGDHNGDGQVSVFELIEYVQRYASQEQMTPPLIHARAKHDFAVLNVTAHGAGRLPVAASRQFAAALLETARRALLIENEVDAAARSLELAGRFISAAEDRRELETLSLTLQALSGDIRGAWREAQQRELPLLLPLPNPAYVYEQSAASRQLVQGRWRAFWQYVDPVVATTQANVIRRVSRIADNRVHCSSVQLLKLHSGTVQFEPATDTQEGWVEIPAFQTSPSRFQTNLDKVLR